MRSPCSFLCSRAHCSLAPSMRRRLLMQAWRIAFSRARGPPHRVNCERTKRKEPRPITQRIVVAQTGLRWRRRKAFILIMYRNKRWKFVAFHGASRRLVDVAVGVCAAGTTRWVPVLYELIYRGNVNRRVGGWTGFENPLFFGAIDSHEVVDAGGARRMTTSGRGDIVRNQYPKAHQDKRG
jgi:hypothetical protein